MKNVKVRKGDMTEITTNTIIDSLSEYVKSKTPIAPSTWVDAAAKLNLLLSDENDILYELEHKIAVDRKDYMEQGMTAAKAKVYVEATDGYKDYRKQKARIEQVIEFVRIAKVQSRVRSEEFKGY